MKDDLPIGFAMALAENPEKMNKFALLDESNKNIIIHKAENAATKSQMAKIVESI